MLPQITHQVLLERELPVAFATKLSFILRGRPGVGKTESIAEFCKRMKISYIDSRVLYFDPTDIKGFPSLDKKAKSFEWLPPAEFPLEGSDTPDEGIWVMEELPLAAPAVQGALFQVINERRVGQKRVKPGWLIVATGNSLTDKAGAQKMLSPMVSRLRHLELVVSAEDWAVYALNHGVMPEMVAFFRFQPELLNSFDPTKWEQDTPYCCPRTAHFLSRTIQALPAHQQAHPPIDILTGWIGEGVGTELYAFLDICNSLPSWAEIMADPTGVKIPDKPGHLYALSSLVSRNAAKANAKQVFAFLDRKDFPDENVMHVVCDMMRGPQGGAISTTTEFTTWGARNLKVFNDLAGLVPGK